MYCCNPRSELQVVEFFEQVSCKLCICNFRWRDNGNIDVNRRALGTGGRDALIICARLLVSCNRSGT